MADVLYVALQDEDKIASFAIDPGTGGLTRKGDVAVAGGPSVMAQSPDGRVVYVGLRTRPAISSFRVDPATGALTPQGSVSADDAPTFLAARPRRPVSPIGLLPGRLCRGSSAGSGWRRWRPHA